MAPTAPIVLSVESNGAVLNLTTGGSAGAVTSVNGQTGAVTVSALSNPMTASGDMITGGAAGVPTRLPAGSANNVLTIIGGVPTWQAPSGGGAVTSVFGRTGAVVATSGDYAVGQVTGAAPLASPALTGTPTAPTQAALTNNTDVATTAYTDSAVAVEKARAQAAEATKAGLLTPTAVKTGAYSAAAGDYVPCDTTSGALTVTLPTTPADLTVIGVKMVKQASSNAVTVAAGGSDVFNVAAGATSLTLLLLFQGVLLQYKASSGIWYVFADDLPLSQLDSRYVAQSSLPLAIGSGGTGQTTQQAAIDALAGAQTSGDYLRGNGTHVVMAAIQSADVPTLNQNTTGSAASFTGSLAGDVTGTQGATSVGKIQGVAVTAAEATLVSDLNNATTRSATATLLPGEETIFTGSTASQTITLPASPPSSSVNTITNAATVSVTLAPGTGATLNNFGTSGNIVIPAGYTFTVVYIGTTWYVSSAGPSDFATNNALAIANGGTGQVTRQAAINGLVGAQTSGQYLRGNGTNVLLAAILAADLPAGTTSAQGALQLDGTASDIQPLGTQGAGASGLAADAKHVHPHEGIWLPSDFGWISWAYDIAAITSSLVLTAGTVYLIGVRLRYAQTVTNVVYSITTAGATLTANQCFAGLYNSSGTLLSATADQSGAGSQALHTVALTTQQTNLAAGLYWVGMVWNGTTPPGIGRSVNFQTSGQENGGLSAANSRWATNGTSQTSLPASITPSSNAQLASALWAAVS